MKKILITFLVLILTVIIGGVTYIFTFDVNSYKGQIEKVILEKTGLPVSIKGQMQLSKSLNPTLIIQDIEIKNAAGFPDTPFMTVKKTELSFDLVAFFKKIISVQNIELSDVSIQLQVNRKGQDNWSRIAQKVQSAEDKKSNKPALSKAAAVSSTAQTQIDLITMKNADISYQNDSTGEKRSVSFPTLSLKGLVNIDGSLVYKKEKFAFSGSIKNLMLVISSKRNLNFSFDVNGLGASSKVSGVCRDITKCADDVTLNFDVKGKDLKKAYAFWGKDLSDIPSSAFTLNAAGRLLKRQLLLEGKLDLSAEGIQLSYNVEYDFKKSAGKGRLDLNVVKPDFIQRYGLQPFSLQTAYVLSQDGHIEFNNITAMFDETDLDGVLVVAKEGNKTVLAGNLHSHYFKMSNVFFEKPQQVVKENKAPEGDVKSLFSKNKIALDFFDKLDMRLNLTVDNWAANNWFARYPVVLADIYLQNGKLTVNLEEGSSFAGGQIVGKLEVDKTADIPVWNLELVGENLNFNQVNLLRKQLRAGSLNANLFLNAKGDSQDAILSSLDGRILLRSNQVEIFSPIVTALFSPTAQGGSSYQTVQDLFIKCGVINATVQNGDIILDKKAAIETSRFNMIIDGDVNLNKETIDMRFIPQKTFARVGQVSQAISAVSLTGSLSNPKPGIEADVSSLLADVLPTIIEPKTADKKSVLDVYRKKTVEDFSVCRVAAEGMDMKTVDLYMGRLPKTEVVEKVVEEKPVKAEPTKAEQIGKQLLDSLSDVLLNQPQPEVKEQKKP